MSDARMLLIVLSFEDFMIHKLLIANVRSTLKIAAGFCEAEYEWASNYRSMTVTRIENVKLQIELWSGLNGSEILSEMQIAIMILNFISAIILN